MSSTVTQIAEKFKPEQKINHDEEILVLLNQNQHLTAEEKETFENEFFFSSINSNRFLAALKKQSQEQQVRYFRRNLSRKRQRLVC